MTAAEILASSRPAGQNSIYFLGCFESRVTVYAQQVRALNLASAMVSEGQIRANGKVAIIGGGAAGITLAAALAALSPKLQNLILFERKPELLHLQMQSRDRYLHPHLYDWPRNGSLESKAGLPLLDWEAGSASLVAAALERRFRPFQEVPFMQVRTSTTVSGILPVGNACRLTLSDGAVEPTLFDAAVVSAGFGYEKYNDEGQASYWDASSLVQPIRNDLSDPELFISGTGDGALVDFSLAAYKHIPHEDLCQFIVARGDLDEVKEELLAIETEAEAVGDGYDLLSAYRSRIVGILPTSMFLEVHERLRGDAKIRFHSRRNLLFRRDTSILNRFLAFLAIWADEVGNATSSRISITTGLPLAKPEFRADGSVHIEGEAVYKPYARLLRFGTETEKLLLPFEPYAQAVKLQKLASPNTYSAATPILTTTASQHFAALKNVPRFKVLTAIPAETPLASPPTFNIDFRIGSDGTVRWSGDSSTIAQAWTVPQLGVTCDFIPSRMPVLSNAIGRLLAHTNSPTLISPDKNEWQRNWKQMTTSTPSPHTRYGKPTLISSESIQQMVDLPDSTSETQLANRIHDQLNSQTLSELNALIVESLDADTPRPYGWNTHSSLRTLLQNRWSKWIETLTANKAMLTRFLILMASERDGEELSDEALIRIGPFTLAATILRSTLFSLHIAETLSTGIAPNSEYPGNFSGDLLRAHACGVAWIDGIDIGSSFRDRSWPSRLILLSELQSPSELTNRYQPRLDETDRGDPSLMRENPVEYPVIISCDDDFRRASASGKASLSRHMDTIFDQLAADAAGSLERRSNV